MATRQPVLSSFSDNADGDFYEEGHDDLTDPIHGLLYITEEDYDTLRAKGNLRQAEAAYLASCVIVRLRYPPEPGTPLHHLADLSISTPTYRRVMEIVRGKVAHWPKRTR